LGLLRLAPRESPLPGAAEAESFGLCGLRWSVSGALLGTRGSIGHLGVSARVHCVRSVSARLVRFASRDTSFLFLMIFGWQKGVG